MNRRKEVSQKIITELKRLGATGISIEHCRKHPYARFIVRKSPHSMMIAGSPGDVRSIKNMTASVRRLVRKVTNPG